MRLAFNLRAARLDRGLSLAKAAEEIGVSVGILQGAEKGDTVPRPKHAKAIADFYGRKVSEVWQIEVEEVAA